MDTEVADIVRIQVALVHALADAESAQRFRSALEVMGFSVDSTVVGTDLAQGRPVIALLSDDLAVEGGGVDECSELLALCPDPIIPVALQGKGSPILNDVSQIPLERLGFTRTVARIGLLVRSGPHDLKEWNSATGIAAEWDKNGRPVTMLTNRTRASQMLELVNRPVSAVDPDLSALARSFALASVEEADSRERRLRRIMAIATSVVASFGVVALIAALFSTQLAGIARADSDRAEATRLAAEAAKLVGYDPDLAQVLAARAAESDPEAPGVAETQWTALQGTVPHYSVLLPAAARSLNAWGDHGVVLTDTELIPVEFHGSHEPRLLPGVRRPDIPVETCSPSPTGTEAACLGPDGAFTIALEGTPARGPVMVTVPAETSHLDWLTENILVAGTEEGVFTLDRGRSDGEWMPLAGGRDEPVQALSVSPTGMEVVYDGAFVFYAPEDQSTLVEVDHDGTFFVDAATPEMTVRTFPDRVSIEGQGAPRFFDGTVVGVVILGGDTVVTATPFGELRWMLPEVVKSRNVVAHLGMITDYAKLDDQRLVTVGTDGYLREWLPGVETPMGLPPTALETVGTTDLSDSTFTFLDGAGAHLPRLGGGDPEGDLLVAGFPMGLFATFSFTGSGPQERTANFVGIGSEPIYLTCDDPTRFGVLDSSSVVMYGETAASFRPGPPRWRGRPEKRVSAIRASAGLSRDCLRIVHADRAAMRVWEVLDGQDDVAPTVTSLDDRGSTPVAVLPDGIPAVVLANGVVVHQDGTVLDLDSPVRAADRQHGRLVAATDRGDAIVLDDGEESRTLTLHNGLDPIRVRLSADGRHAAFVGLRFGQIVDLDSGKTLALVSSDAHASAVDVVMGPDDAVVLFRDLTLSRIQMVPPESLATRLIGLAPRALTEAEIERFGIKGAP